MPLRQLQGLGPGILLHLAEVGLVDAAKSLSGGSTFICCLLQFDRTFVSVYHHDVIAGVDVR